MKKQELLDKIREYSKTVLPNPNNFKPGVDDVTVSGAVIFPDDIVSVCDTVLDGWFTEGKSSHEFSELLSEYLGIQHILLCNSGSSANLIAMSAVKDLYGSKARPKMKVITCATGFSTTIAPIIQLGLIPLFVDAEPLTLNPRTETILSLLERDDVAGIIQAHTLGFPFDAISISSKCAKLNKFFIEDCADCLGSLIDDELTGRFGDIATFSFFPAHVITTGQGGALAISNRKLYNLAHNYCSWGRACFVKDTVITTKNGAKHIQDINPSEDLVLSHSGNFNAVTQTFHRKYSGKLYTVKLQSRPKLSVTSEHPFLVLRDGIEEWIYAKDLNIGDVLIERIPRPIQEQQSNFMWSYDIASKTVVETLQYHPDLFRLIGYWLSQGSLAKGLKGKSGYSENKYFCYRVDFCFHESLTETIEDLKLQMKKFFGCNGHIRTHKNNHSVTVCFKSRKAYEFFKKFCGVGAVNKHVPYEIMQQSPELLINLVWGFILGDGHKDFQGYSLYSVSYEMIEQIRRILLQNGIVTSANIRTNDKHKVAIVNGRPIIQRNNLWTLRLYGINAEILSDLCGDDYVTRTSKRMIKINLNECYVYYRILDISVTDVVDLDVYNLEVQNDHSYHANGVIAHNCICSPGETNVCGNRFGYKWENLPDGFDHKYTYTKIGYNLEITDMQSALGKSQFTHLDDFIYARKWNYSYLRDGLDELHEHLQFVQPLPNSEPSPFGFPISVISSATTKNDLVAYLESNKIRTRPVFSGNIVRHPMMENVQYRVAEDLKGSDWIMNNTFWIGCHPGLTSTHLDYVLETIYKYFKKEI